MSDEGMSNEAISSGLEVASEVTETVFVLGIEVLMAEIGIEVVVVLPSVSEFVGNPVVMLMKIAVNIVRSAEGNWETVAVDITVVTTSNVNGIAFRALGKQSTGKVV